MTENKILKCVRQKRFFRHLTPFEQSLANRWGSMMSRCYNPNRPKYPAYGGRGIKVCKEWHDIKVFAEWCKTSGYSPELQLDRINNNGDYCPENCRWATCRQNSQNRRNTNFITANSITLCVAEWARKLDISHNTIYWWTRQGKKYAEKRLMETILTKGGLL